VHQVDLEEITSGTSLVRLLAEAEVLDRVLAEKEFESPYWTGMIVQDLAVASFRWNCNLAVHAGKHFSACGSSPKVSKLLWRLCRSSGT
jgi:hypothetical protein